MSDKAPCYKLRLDDIEVNVKFIQTGSHFLMMEAKGCVKEGGPSQESRCEGFIDVDYSGPGLGELKEEPFTF